MIIMENRKREVGLWMGKKKWMNAAGTAKAGPVNGNR